ncbi:hypothetical protein MSAN_02268100 [Mycena sanguinolenta]|uniref:Uncharacterized protein n=1 Tax=Mycena sanguinolenta TaxID=230812 RepID=A0A8H6XB62_9AGAR|nr:hypothetical protein MSAN_02268100 [Mycena sanguinolenta]
MSASYSKDRAVGIAIWQAPPNLSKEDFEAKLTNMVDKLVAVPIAQKNYVKYEMMFQTAFASEELMVHGVAEGAPSVWMIAECATVAEYLEIFEDPAIMNVLRDGKDNVYGGHPIAKASLGDVRVWIDRPVANNRARLVCAVQRPGNFSVDGYRKAIEAFADRFPGFSIVQKNVVKHWVWFPHNTVDTHVSAIGLSAPAPDLAICVVETESHDGMIEMLNDSDFKTYMEDGRRELNIHIGSSYFVANVVTKINK